VMGRAMGSPAQPVCLQFGEVAALRPGLLQESTSAA
jgi:hypothetical protein